MPLVRHAATIFDHVPVQHVEIRRFTAVDGFTTLTYLSHLKTLKLYVTNDETALRRLMLCDQFNDSMLLFVYYTGYMSPVLRDELQKTFGERIRVY